MKLYNALKVFKKDTVERKEVIGIISKLPDNDNVTKEILEMLGNKTTKCKRDEDFKGSYYVFLNDTIFLSDRKECKDDYSRICLIAHECIHSVQSKILQKLNFVVSNIDIIAFLVIFVLRFVFGNISFIPYIYLVIAIVSSIPRIILEIDAVKRSTIVSYEYMEGKIEKNELEYIDSIYKFQTKLLLPLFLLNLLIWKIVRCVFIFILYYIVVL